jgi:hypothetical protein
LSRGAKAGGQKQFFFCLSAHSLSVYFLFSIVYFISQFYFLPCRQLLAKGTPMAVTSPLTKKRRKTLENTHFPLIFLQTNTFIIVYQHHSIQFIKFNINFLKSITRHYQQFVFSFALRAKFCLVRVSIRHQPQAFGRIIYILAAQ